ncbi:MAG: MFS transporter [Actinomycetota bacterium]|nr:MFS transporter [Actinomycetota bacterium]MDA2996898.1 MFS transporter [Actinomycetota bacterium]
MSTEKLAHPGKRELTSRGFFCATVAFAMMGFTSTSWGPMLPWIAERNNLSISTSGLILAGFSLHTLIGTILVQVFGPKMDLIWFIRRGIFVAFIGFIGVVTLNNAVLLTLSGCFAGVGYGATGLALLQLFTRSSNASHVRMNLASAATGFGTLAGPFTIGMLGSSNIPAIIIFAVGTSLVATRFLTGADWRVEKFKHYSQTKQNQFQLFIILLAVIFYSGLENSIGVWLPTIIKTSNGSLESGALSSAFFYLFFLAGRFFGVYIARHLEPHTIILVGILATLLPFLFAMFSRDHMGLGLALCGFFLGPIFPNSSSWIARKTPGFPFATTLLMISIMAGAFIFPPILGFILEIGGIDGFLVALATLLGLSAAFFTYSHKYWRS